MGFEPSRPLTAATRWSLLAVVTGLMAGAALLTPIWSSAPVWTSGILLLLGVAAEVFATFRTRSTAALHSAWGSAGFTLLLALVLLSADWVAVTALALFVAAPFALDSIRQVRTAVRLLAGHQPGGSQTSAALINLGAVVGVLLLGRYGPHWVVALAAGTRLSTVTLNIARRPSYSEEDVDRNVVEDIGIERPERLADTAARLHEAERNRAAADRGWIAALLAVLFAIHVSRMGFDKSALGILSPVVAVLGDVAVALALTYFVIVPGRLFVRRGTRRLERAAWQQLLDRPADRGPAAWTPRAIRWTLESRMRFAIRLRSARYSLSSAVGRGLQIGLPLTAVIVASVPVWGMSWYFDTENWAAGIWNSWSASRTDVWRAAMVRSLVSSGRTTLDGAGFAVTPAGISGSEPFSFVVIGDTGEGDASQHVLKDSLLRATAADDVRFVILSSDVVYPTGAMKDYELRFWLPFKGVTKPLYAIPGNHDWYDALESFAATFFTPEAARLAMRARVESDEGVSSTTDGRIEELIRRADFLRRQYGVPTGGQQAPFFQIQTPAFALIAVDTGVLRSIDGEQRVWLQSALEASRGKMVMAILGHPFFVAGHDVTRDDEQFAALRRLLSEYGVRVVMAGDTHDLEHYEEPVDHDRRHVIDHWVNGGGGAYLSYGSALAWPPTPDIANWAYYPGQRDVVEKIRNNTPWWKWPAWVWTRRFGAWPFSAEWLSAMFDYNVAPFFQSFVVVTVDPSRRQIAIRPWGVHGPLRWSEFDRSSMAVPNGAALDEPVEWVVR